MVEWKQKAETGFSGVDRSAEFPRVSGERAGEGFIDVSGESVLDE
ncbi:MAG: hypothetical protein Q4F41_01180 [Eubacteriales bacterium]|nr:hypothetical protein [Eubacteriales bacterium]